MALPEAYNTQMTEEEIAAAFKNAAKVPDLESAVAANTANVAAAQSEAAINRTTLGYESYNLCNATVHTETTANGVTYSAAGGHFVANGTTTGSFTVYITRIEIYATEDLWIHPATTLANVTYHARVLRVDGTSNYPSIGTNGLKISAGETIKDIYIQQSASGKTVEADIYVMVTPLALKDKPFMPYVDSADERLKAVESSVEITKPTLTVNTTYIASSRLYCHKVGKLVFVQGTITTAVEVPAWTTGLISGLPTISQTYYFKLFRTGSTVGSPTVYLNGGGTTVNVDNNALAAEATYYLNFCYIEH